MLSNLASYLLGYSDSSRRGAEPTTDEPKEAETAPNQRLISETEEDDWVVVSKPGEDGEGEGGCVGMEESWFVTPPPCFASTGPVSVETSPLENLLIEHPSMSVYRRGSPTVRRVSPRPADENTRPRAAPLQQPPLPQPRHRHPLHQIVQHHQIKQLHIAQKQQIKRSGEMLKANHLEKDNKVREVNGRNRRQRRSDRQRKHSGANNNRKC